MPPAPHAQVTSHEAGPFVCIWDSRLGSSPSGPAGVTELKRIQFAKEDRGIICLAFSPTGKWLVCVASDNQHTVYIYDWKVDRQVCSGKGMMGEPPQVRGWCRGGGGGWCKSGGEGGWCKVGGEGGWC